VCFIDEVLSEAGWTVTFDHAVGDAMGSPALYGRSPIPLERFEAASALVSEKGAQGVRFVV